MAMGIHCCKYCVAPKRHAGCHGTCEEYKQEKIQLEQDKKIANANRSPRITVYDFNRTDYIKCRQRKRQK